MTVARNRNSLTCAMLALTAALFVPTLANAGQCPADKVKAGARTSGETAPKDVTDETLGAVELGSQIDGLDGRNLRFRKLVVQPGGIVPWHDHTDRPALILTVSGEMTEYRSDCKVGVVHKEGEIALEVAGVQHWWKNEGTVPAVLHAADIKRD